MDTASGLEWAEGGRPAAIAFEFPAADSSSTPSRSPRSKVPGRIRRRLTGCRSTPCSVEEIEAKLREADLRRQQFHECLSNKARTKLRCAPWSLQDEEYGQRLEAKLCAAEQKRLSLLQKTQMRLSRLNELRQSAKAGVEMRFEKEREELGMKVESRMQHAEANRILLLQTRMQRIALVQEKKAQSLLKQINREKKYKDLVRAATYQKRVAAEKKRLGLLETEKTRARAKIIQACRVAKFVCQQREIERRMKEELEDRLQRAKKQRGEYLRQRGSPSCSSRITLIEMHNHGDFLSRKIARCWRQFVKLRKTTLSLAEAYKALEINEDLVRSIPFGQLACCIEAAKTLETTKALLDRLVSRLMLPWSFSQSGPENIDHLLKHVASSKKRVSTDKETQGRGQTKRAFGKELRSHEPCNLSRYPVRAVLCAYMIFGHPDVVFSKHGEHEIALVDSATSFIQEFESLINLILIGPDSVPLSRRSSPDMSSTQLPKQQTFRSQLAAFDAAWCSYLHRFVAWKVKDARLLEEDLVRVACQLELSMMQKCKLSPEGKSPDLSHDMRAIQKQVTEDQRLLREKVQHLSGSAGIERMEHALSSARAKYFEAKESGSPTMTPIAHISSSSSVMSSSQSDSSAILTSTEKRCHFERGGRSSSVVRSLFKEESSNLQKRGPSVQGKDPQTPLPVDKQFMENEVLVNEMLHQRRHSFVDGSNINGKEMDIKAKVKETMEKAFWDEVMESLRKEQPDYGRIIVLVKEVRDELCGMTPKSWKGEILDSIDLDILSQVLESRTNDMSYLGKILEYALGMLLKLSAPVNEAEMKKTHEKFLMELADTAAESKDQLNSPFVTTVVSGLRFVLEQALKQEISRARIQMIEPIIRGPSGVEYLQKAFANHYGPPSDAATTLPLTAQWISSARESLQEWEEHTDSLSTLPTSQGLPPLTALRSGGNIPSASSSSLSLNQPTTLSNSGVLPECKGERVDVMVRLGLLKLASGIEGLTQEAAPETLKLNFQRLRNVQSQLQKIIVICTRFIAIPMCDLYLQ
uniref:T-complex protein 11 n=1 Tax=Anthurium amnicola TaxID=1678845 RepID=A0A1D1YR82_9ARAE